MDGACIVTSIGSPPSWATSLDWLFVVSLKLLFGDTWFLCTDSCLGIPFLATRTPLFVLFELARIFVRLPPIEGAWIVTSICPPPLWETSLKWLVPWPLWFGKVVSCTIASYAGGGDIGAARLAGTVPGGSASYAGGAIGPSSGRGSAIHKRIMNRDWKSSSKLNILHIFASQWVSVHSAFWGSGVDQKQWQVKMHPLHGTSTYFYSQGCPQLSLSMPILNQLIDNQGWS